MRRLSHLSSSTKPPRGAGQSREAESLRRFLVQLQLLRFSCDYACDSPPQAFWHRDQPMILFPFVPPSQPCQHMPVCHARPRTGSGNRNLQNNNSGERKNRESHQLDGFPVASGFSDILCCRQPEMVSGAAVQKDARISR